MATKGELEARINKLERELIEQTEANEQLTKLLHDSVAFVFRSGVNLQQLVGESFVGPTMTSDYSGVQFVGEHVTVLAHPQHQVITVSASASETNITRRYQATDGELSQSQLAEILATVTRIQRIAAGEPDPFGDTDTLSLVDAVNAS